MEKEKWVDVTDFTMAPVGGEKLISFLQSQLLLVPTEYRARADFEISFFYDATQVKVGFFRPLNDAEQKDEEEKISDLLKKCDERIAKIVAEKEELLQVA